MKPVLPIPPFLYPIVDVGLLGERRVGEVVAALVRGGARMLQLRAKAVSDRRLVELAREAPAATREGGALLLVNDRPDVARILGADGVHLGHDDLPPADARTVLGPDAIVGFSTLCVEQPLVAIRRDPARQRTGGRRSGRRRPAGCLRVAAGGRLASSMRGVPGSAARRP